jgi:hypothetical protein
MTDLLNLRKNFTQNAAPDKIFVDSDKEKA